MSSSFGALYDSVLDRYSELIVFLGICSYMMAQGYVVGFIIAFIALVGSLMVSYVRARAEGLGIECKVGDIHRYTGTHIRNTCRIQTVPYLRS